LSPELKRSLGVGNSTGLGMAPFLINHPALINNWIQTRELALSRVRQLAESTDASAAGFLELVRRQQLINATWTTDHEPQANRVCELQGELTRLLDWLETNNILAGPQPWDTIYRFAEEELSLEAQECCVSLMLEPHGDLVDALTPAMSADEDSTFSIDGSTTLEHLRLLLQQRYEFARDHNYDDRNESARFWYVSEEKLEPRLGERYEEDGAELENPLATGRDALELWEKMDDLPSQTTVAEFLLLHPECRHSVRRAQIAEQYPYSEIRDNLIGSDMLPIDLLRCKLSFFGAVKFDPRSDRWVRITMYQHAPLPDELSTINCDDWIYPPLPNHTVG